MNKLRVLKLMLSRLWASLFYTKKFERTILINVKDLGLNRYIYQLIKYFERAGYNVVIPVRSHLFRTFDVKVKNIFEDKVVGIFVKRNDIILEVTSSEKDELTTGKQWTLNSKIYFEHLYDTTLPFPMAHEVYKFGQDLELVSYRSLDRSMRIFFSGNQHKKIYSDKIIADYFHKMNRVELLNRVKTFAASVGNYISIDSFKHLRTVLPSKGELNKYVQTDWVFENRDKMNLDSRIPNDRWLEFLSKAHFWLAAPGVKMPMCHNTIEAMAVGTIPIIEYPEHFNPKLEHLKNCIVISPNNLEERIQEVFEMNPLQIHKLKEGVEAYYDSHLAPIKFVENTLKKESTEVYLHASMASIV